MDKLALGRTRGRLGEPRLEQLDLVLEAPHGPREQVQVDVAGSALRSGHDCAEFLFK
jgi:hypothetical protein